MVKAVNNGRLYEVLGVTPSASQQEIKRGYYEMAQRYHPDRQVGGESNEDRFKVVQGAYDVLKDEEKKAVYDRYGEEGLKLLNQGWGNMASVALVNPLVISCAVCSVLLPSLLALVFLCLRIDEEVSWSWGVTFIPVWIILALAVLTMVAEFVHQRSVATALPLLSMLLRLVFMILLTLRLDKDIDASWAWVFSPVVALVVHDGVWLVKRLPRAYYKELCAGTGRPVTGKGYARFVATLVLSFLTTLLFVLLIVLRLTRSITSSWFVVGVPFYVFAFLKVVATAFTLEESCGELVLPIITEAWQVLQFVLIMWKADGGSLTMAVALVPTWVALGLACFIPCCWILSSGVMQQQEPSAEPDSDVHSADAHAGGADAAGDAPAGSGASAGPPPAAAPSNPVEHVYDTHTPETAGALPYTRATDLYDID